MSTATPPGSESSAASGQPVYVFDIPLSEVGSAPIRGFDAYWHGKIRDGRLPAREDIDPAEIVPLLPDIVLLNVEWEPFRCRVRLRGTRAEQFRPIDTTKYIDNSTIFDPGRHYQNRYIVGVSTDLRLGVFAGGTVVLAAAQVGMALGYRDIHFVGLDMKPCGTQGRFYSEGKPEPSFIDRNLDGLILPSFAVLRRYCDAEGIVLCNWSPDSAVPRSLVPAALRDVDLAVSAA